ncbi:MAG: LytTR family DNA-binding domain-containing protein [Collinsella sp.]|nr:LytTR family DNA-binding domain-containing protein [Collinsella sp.]
MRIDIELDPDISETQVVIRARELGREVEAIRRAIETSGAGDLRRVLGVRGSDASPLEVADIQRFHTEGRDVLAQTASGSWRVRQRINELASALDPQEFIQINQGEIVNLRFVRRLDLTLTGTIRLELTDGTSCFVSRRSLRAFKAALGI